jgi:hypothetical protein
MGRFWFEIWIFSSLGGLHEKHAVQRGIWVPTQHLLYFHLHNIYKFSSYLTGNTKIFLSVRADRPQRRTEAVCENCMTGFIAMKYVLAWLECIGHIPSDRKLHDAFTLDRVGSVALHYESSGYINIENCALDKYWNGQPQTNLRLHYNLIGRIYGRTKTSVTEKIFRKANLVYTLLHNIINTFSTVK